MSLRISQMLLISSSNVTSVRLKPFQEAETEFAVKDKWNHISFSLSLLVILLTNLIFLFLHFGESF